ncbi:hypothetical protein ACJJTC_006438 [Scirpophaga incertulas]
MELIQEYGFDFVHNAYVQELRSRGDPEEASIVSTLRTLNRDDKKTIKQQLLHEVETVSSYSIHEALSIYIDLNLKKIQYGCTGAQVKLQDLLHHTVARILLIDTANKPDLQNLKLFSKWGCDGSSGQSEYKQILPGESDTISDANVLNAPSNAAFAFEGAFKTLLMNNMSSYHSVGANCEQKTTVNV